MKVNMLPKHKNPKGTGGVITSHGSQAIRNLLPTIYKTDPELAKFLANKFNVGRPWTADPLPTLQKLPADDDPVRNHQLLEQKAITATIELEKQLKVLAAKEKELKENRRAHVLRNVKNEPANNNNVDVLENFESSDSGSVMEYINLVSPTVSFREVKINPLQANTFNHKKYDNYFGGQSSKVQETVSANLKPSVNESVFEFQESPCFSEADTFNSAEMIGDQISVVRSKPDDYFTDCFGDSVVGKPSKINSTQENTTPEDYFPKSVRLRYNSAPTFGGQQPSNNLADTIAKKSDDYFPKSVRVHRYNAAPFGGKQ